MILIKDRHWASVLVRLGLQGKYEVSTQKEFHKKGKI